MALSIQPRPHRNGLGTSVNVLTWPWRSAGLNPVKDLCTWKPAPIQPHTAWGTTYIQIQSLWNDDYNAAKPARGSKYCICQCHIYINSHIYYTLISMHILHIKTRLLSKSLCFVCHFVQRVEFIYKRFELTNNQVLLPYQQQAHVGGWLSHHDACSASHGQRVAQYLKIHFYVNLLKLRF